MSSPLKQQVTSTRPLAVARSLALALCFVSSLAHAQSMGQGLISYATPIILFLGIGAVVVALVAAIFKPELVKTAIWAAIILVVVFFLLKNTASFQAAVQ